MCCSAGSERDCLTEDNVVVTRFRVEISGVCLVFVQSGNFDEVKVQQLEDSLKDLQAETI